MQLGRRIAVVGTSGSGKTTVAQGLARKLNYRYVSNDALLFKPNWELNTHQERYELFSEALSGERWVTDGNIRIDSPWEDAVILRRIDTLIWLDLPLPVVLWRLTRRTLRRIVTQEELWHGNRESWSTFFSRHNVIRHALRTRRTLHRSYTQLFIEADERKLRTLRITSDAECAAMLRHAGPLLPTPG